MEFVIKHCAEEHKIPLDDSVMYNYIDYEIANHTERESSSDINT